LKTNAHIGRAFAVVLALTLSFLTFDAAASLQSDSPGTQRKAKDTNQKSPVTPETASEQPQTFTATAYALHGRTASGTNTRRGIIAADRRVLPMGTRVRVDAGNGHSGEYVVADTGGAIKGRKIDIWVPSNGEAMRFGRRQVKLTVMSYPQKKQKKAAPAARRKP